LPPPEKHNLLRYGAHLMPEQAARLDKASAVILPYPYWHQRGFIERDPVPV
jgi:hypothetical protein